MYSPLTVTFVPRNCVGLNDGLTHSQTIPSVTNIGLHVGKVVGSANAKLPATRFTLVPRQLDNTRSYDFLCIEAFRSMSARPATLSQIIIVLLIVYSSGVAPTMSMKSSLYPISWMLSAETFATSPVEFAKHAFIKLVGELRIV